MTDSELMTTKEAAAFLRVHMITLSQWAKHGYVPGMKVGKNWRFARHELTAWLNDPVRRLHLVPTANEPVPPPQTRKRPVRSLGRVDRPVRARSSS